MPARSTNAGLDSDCAPYLQVAGLGYRVSSIARPSVVVVLRPSFPAKQGRRAFSLVSADMREDADVIRRPEPPWFSPFPRIRCLHGRC